MTGTTIVPSATRGRFTLRKIFGAATFVYAAVVLIYLLLRVLGALGLPVLDTDGGLFGSLVGVGSSLMPALLIPALPLMLLAAVWRLPKIALALAPAVAAFALLYGPMLLPKPAQAAPETPSLTVYTHNLHVMTDELAGIEAEIRASGADVVALQELTEPAAEFLAAALHDLYPYTALNPVGVTTHGAGILSKWPLRETETWITSMAQMRTTVDWPGGTFAFYNLHPPPPRWFLQPFDATDRAVALNEALRRASEETLPVMLAGDFNLTDQTADYQQITGAGYQDAYREAGWGLGLTFADFGGLFKLLSLAPPFIRIDYVFGGPEFTPLAASVGAAAGSDHYAVRAEWGLKPW